MNESLISALYDLLVYVTNNYSQMPVDFKARFSEGRCVWMRKDLFDYLNS